MAFRKIENDGKIPGPRAFFLSGFNTNGINKIEQLLKESSITGIDIVAAKEKHLGMKVEDVLQDNSEEEILPEGKLPPVILMSGIYHEELNKFMDSYKKSGLKRPIYASATDSNLNFDLKTLLTHLLEEQKMLMKKRKGK